MNKLVKKVTGVILLIALLVTTAGTSAQAVSEVKWPYGTYKCTTKGFEDERIEWEYASDPSVKYDQLIYSYLAGMKSMSCELYKMKRVKKNTYRTKIDKDKFYAQVVVGKNTLVFRTFMNGKPIKWGYETKLKFKIKKRLSKNVG